MSEHFEMTEARILIYVDLSEEIEEETIPIELFSSVEVILLGIYPVPDQSAPEQVKEQVGEEAERTLEAFANRFRETGCAVETRVVFTADSVKTINTTAEEEHCEAILTPGVITGVDRVLIPIRGHVNLERISYFVSDLLEDTPTNVTLVSMVEDEADRPDQHSILQQLENMLAERGLKEAQVEFEVIEVDDATEGIIEEAGDYDLVIMGESQPKMRDLILGTINEQVMEESEAPLITVRAPESEDSGEDEDS